MKTLKEQFAANEITIEEYVAALEVENKVATDKLRKQSSSTLRLKVSEKGGLSIYGLGRFQSRCTKVNGNVCLALRRKFTPS